MKKLFIKICKLFGLEIIDQNRFSSPTLNKELSQDLSILNEKSIILPLGEVKITRKVKSILIIISGWEQTKHHLSYLVYLISHYGQQEFDPSLQNCPVGSRLPSLVSLL